MVRMELLAHICQFCCTVTSRDSLTSLDTAQDQVRGRGSSLSLSLFNCTFFSLSKHSSLSPGERRAAAW